MRLSTWSLGLCAIWIVCAIVGALVDPVPTREPVERAGYRVLAVDFHVHTRQSDGFHSPFGVVMQARRRGLDAIAITEHNIIFPAEQARWFSERIGGPIVLVGEEVTTRDYHVLAVGLTRRVDASRSLTEVVTEVRAQGGFVAAAHPVERFWPALRPHRADMDATEVVHPSVYRPARPGWDPGDMVRYYEGFESGAKPLAALATSDYHFFSPLGICRTLVFVDEVSGQGIVDAVKARRTVAYDPKGTAYGDPALIRALEAQPMPALDYDYGYRGAGWLDRLARGLGLVAMALLVVLRRRRSPEAS